jgi:FKBP-type peptidyl-prolyl cis-trans isomerase
MTRKQIAFVAIIAALSMAALIGGAQGARAAQPAKPAAATTVPVEAQLQLQDEGQKTLYTLGLLLSQNLTRLSLQESELAYVVKGLQDGVLGRPALVKLEEYAPKVQALAQQRMAAAAQQAAEKAKEYMAKMAAMPGATKTESGIVILSLEGGSGASPTKTDTVRVHYEGTLADGSVFDSSVKRGEPVSFPLEGVIACWTEAVQKMKVGGKMKVVCPPELAYGPQGRPGIPPNAPLTFEIQLLGIGAEPAPTPAPTPTAGST